MKSYSLLARLKDRLAQRCRRLTAHRRGTVIIVVLALLGLLALIGFFVVGITSQENQSATYFSNSQTAKVPSATYTSASAFFDDILRQVIVGPTSTERQTVMYGGRNSLLPTMFGRDMAAYNGPGVNLIWNNSTGYPAIDQNYDGFQDTGIPNLMQLNFSPGAQAVLVPPANLPIDFNNFLGANNVYPDPDTNITYPDFNSPFLASDTLVPNGTGNPVRVIIPSFHRPMLLRNAPAFAGGTVVPYTWYTDKNTASLVLFPHSEHLAVDSSGNLPSNTSAVSTQRFVSNIYPDNSGIGTPLQPFPIPGDAAAWASSTAYVLGARVQPSPINQHIYVCTTAGTSGGTAPTFPTAPGATVADGTVVWTEWSQEGVWTWPLASGPIGTTPYNYDVDTNNDGVPDARYMDFGFPLMQDANGNSFVALGAVYMIDADSLLNLNVHGNRAALAQLPVATNFAGGNNPGFLSLSDHGVSASEVNPQWALNARVFFNSGTGLYQSPDFSSSLTPAAQSTAITSALQQYTLFFRPGGSGNNPLNNFDLTEAALSYELSNMEMWNLLNGRPQLSAGTPPTVSGSSFVGRYGENTTHLDPYVTQILAGTSFSAGASVGAPTDPFPLPGTWNYDDNNNQAEGGTFYDQQNVFHPAFVQPVDFFTAGLWVTGWQGKQRLLYPYQTTGTAAGNEQFPQYSQFYIAPTVQWANVLATALVPGWSSRLLVDDTDETFLEPAVAAIQTTDSIFGSSENAIQLSGTDYSSLGNPGRTASLMSFNFVANQRAALIRQRFTSTSWDLKSYGKPFLGSYDGATNDARRAWEFTDLSGATPPTGPYRFPPNFVGTNGTLTPQTSGFTTPDDATTTGSGSGTTANVPFVYPIRTPVANLIQILANPNQISTPATTTILPQRPLSVNGVTEMYANGTDSNNNTIYQFRFRPLTPHPSTATNYNVSPAIQFAAAPITPFPAATHASTTLPSVSWVAEPEQLQANNFAQQEWLARYDRQRMARDIYTLLYLTGGGREANAWRPSAAYAVGALAVSSPPNGHIYICTTPGTSGTSQPTSWPTSPGGTVTDGSVTWIADQAAGPPVFAAGTFANYAMASNQPNATTGIRPVYTEDQLQEMAQFAVNVVDALDPDSNITLFEYDKDLSDGWNLDDNAYDATNDPLPLAQRADRGLVYGIERQQLCLNESMVTLSQPCINSANMAKDHPDTQWDDTRQWSFFYTELENVGPTPVQFNNAQWQIVVKQSPIMTQNSPYYGTGGIGSAGEMRMTLVGLPITGSASSQTAIGSQGSSTLPTLAAGLNTGGTGGNTPRLTIGGMIASAASPSTATTNLGAIAGPPFTWGNPYVPTTPTSVAPSYMLVNPNDQTGTDTPTLTNSDYQFPIAPRAAYGTGATTAASPWWGNASILTPTMNGLDLIDTNQQNNYWITQPNAGSPNADQPIGTVTGAGVGIAPGSQLLQFNDATGLNLLPGTAPVVLRIELRRRADLLRLPFLPTDPNQVQESADNPWVTVDYMDVPVSVMALKLTATGGANDYFTQVQGQLGAFFQPTWTGKTNYTGYYAYSTAASPPPLISTERSQPLYHDYQLNPWNPSGPFINGPFVASSAAVYQRNGGSNTLGPPLWQGNSLGQDNDAAGFNPGTIPSSTAKAINPHPLYQPHYDRDFTSIGELFNIPLYGQMQAMAWLPNTTYPVGTVIVPPSGTAPGVGGMAFLCTQSGMSGSTPPVWPTTWGAPVSDGSSTPALQWTPIAGMTPTGAGTTPPMQTQMFTGLTHLMGSRVTEGSTPTNGTPPTTELLVGSDYVPNGVTATPTAQPQHYVGYGTAGFRFQHPEGGDQRYTNPDYAGNASVTSDFTENRWFRLLGFLEVPTRQHRGINEPNGVYPYDVAAGAIYGTPGFYRTAGKINVNALRFPDIVAGLIGEPAIFNMNFTGTLPTGQNLPANLSVPYLLHDIPTSTDPDLITVPPPQNVPAWTGGTVFGLGASVVPTAPNGFSYICVTAGTTGGTQPSWPTAFGSTVTDGSVVWAPNPAYGLRDWWLQFITSRDGVDPLPLNNGGTGLSIPGMPRAPMLPMWVGSTTYSLGATITPSPPNGYTYVCTTPGTSGTSQPSTWPTTLPAAPVTDGTAVWTLEGITPSGSQPFHELGFSAYGGVDSNGYNGPLESTLLRSLSSDSISPPSGFAGVTPAPTFDLRRRLFELGTNTEHTASNWDYATKQRLLSRLAGNTTTRSNVFFVWIQVDFFQAKDVGPSLTPPDTGVVRIGSKLATSPAYRGFFVIDRSQALPLMTSQYLPSAVSGQPFVFSFNQSFNWQSLVLYQQRIQ